MSAVLEICARIKGQPNTRYRDARPVADLAALISNQMPILYDTAYVFKGRYRADKNRSDNRVKQWVNRTYGVITVTRHADNASGERNSLRQDELDADLIAALLGFEPANHTQLTLASGGLQTKTNEFQFWLDTFECKTDILAN